MLNEIEKILNEYEEGLDREYDNDQILMMNKANNTLQLLKSELKILLSVIPNEINRSTIEKLKKIL